MATILAQPILRPSLFQPGENFHALHSPLKTTPTPHDDEASTQNSTEETGGGFENIELQNVDLSCNLHQLISAKTIVLGVFQMKGEDKKLKEVA